MRLLTPSLLALALVPGLALADLKETMKQQAAQQASEKMESAFGLPQSAPADASVYFIEPADGATLKGPVRVIFGLRNMGVAPAGVNQEKTGHHHLLINEPEVNLAQPLPASDQIIHFGGGQTETTLTLPKGTHTLQLLLGDWKHQPHQPPVMSNKIKITVQ